MSSSYTWLEEIRLKRMVVTDDCLELIAKSFKNFKVLVLSSCEGFSTDGSPQVVARRSFLLRQGREALASPFLSSAACLLFSRPVVTSLGSLFRRKLNSE
ncbi:hypothetical protein ISN45_Aa04g002080 [Arabidopsis thaliana x Arabidopsis arenosa]|uniref:Uncharacterized protein n=1 Tax=Arabidopsis thaliana x Arabidopsis arenosa TaxID=1240361 RepID=A0A8T2A3W8_9BRAS|nr:hypothetical protein ISN45_Aa04g002080 [Arabidopsis thaliana x Arabidopsis arenosa]